MLYAGFEYDLQIREKGGGGEEGRGEGRNYTQILNI